MARSEAEPIDYGITPSFWDGQNDEILLHEIDSWPDVVNPNDGRWIHRSFRKIAPLGFLTEPL